MRQSSGKGSPFNREWVRLRRRRRRTAVGVAVALLVIAAIGAHLQASYPVVAGAGAFENEALEQTRGADALRFRHLQQIDENGEIPNNAIVEAKAHVDRMRGRRPTGFGPAVAGIAPNSWDWLGPGNVGGRIRSILIHPTVPSTMWVGSVTGGIFKTTNGGGSGRTWTTSWRTWPCLRSSRIPRRRTRSTRPPARTSPATASKSHRRREPRRRRLQVDGRRHIVVAARVDRELELVVHEPACGRTRSSASTLLAATWAGIFRTVNGGTSWTLEYTNQRGHPGHRLRSWKREQRDRGRLGHGLLLGQRRRLLDARDRAPRHRARRGRLCREQPERHVRLGRHQRGSDLPQRERRPELRVRGANPGRRRLPRRRRGTTTTPSGSARRIPIA